MVLEEVILVHGQFVIRRGPESCGRQVALEGDIAFGEELAVLGILENRLPGFRLLIPQAVPGRVHRLKLCRARWRRGQTNT
jgi:hypothetical protein